MGDTDLSCNKGLRARMATIPDPGVCCIASRDLAVYSRNLQTCTACKWAQGGRMQLLAGSNQQHLRDRFYDDVVRELMHWHGKEVTLLSNFQCDFSKPFQFLVLAVTGWQAPKHCNVHGHPVHGTYQFAGSLTKIDTIACSPDANPTPCVVSIHPVPHVVHKMLCIPIELQVQPPQS